MLKFLIIMILVTYVIFKVGGYLFKIFFIGASHASQQATDQGKRKAPNSNLNIDYAPKDGKGRKEEFKGGDYIDYEEVK